MIEFSGRGLLLDIEGTVAPIAYVYDILFPFARAQLSPFLMDHWDDPEVAAAREQIARDTGAESFEAWYFAGQNADPVERLSRHLIQLMNTDAKSTGLKALQGLIWRGGYERGELKSTLFDDVPATLRAWVSAKRDVRIYSSGSVEAQRVFFAHTTAGDLTPLLRGHYDTRVGPKQSSGSYSLIAADMQLSPNQVLFLSDVVGELDAARESGMRTGLVARPGNRPTPPGHEHPTITNFGQIALG